MSMITASATCATTSAPRPRIFAVDPRPPCVASTSRRSGRDDQRAPTRVKTPRANQREHRDKGELVFVDRDLLEDLVRSNHAN